MPTFRDDMATSSRDAAAIEFTKTPFVAATTPRKISSVRFSLMSDAEIGRAGVFHVCERKLVSDAAADTDAEWYSRPANGDDG
jgi:hypothetical protein